LARRKTHAKRLFESSAARFNGEQKIMSWPALLDQFVVAGVAANRVAFESETFERRVTEYS
jgi:hypothetical protein